MEILQPIGKYVHLVDERNTDLAITNLLGVAKEKYFMPSVANVIGTDLSKYKVIRKGRFACNLMHVSRDEVLPVALYIDKEPSIISPAYPMFEVNDSAELLPEYLNMYLMRKEFDREVVFYAMNGVRGGLEWGDFMNMQMPVPPIEVQRRIVDDYQTIEQRITNNNQLIQKLEATAQAIYHHTFVENIDPENLPDGWRTESLYNIATFQNGLACQNFLLIGREGLPVLKIKELNEGRILDDSDFVNDSFPQSHVVQYGDLIFSWSATLLIKFWAAEKAALNQHLFKVTSIHYPKWFIYLWIKHYIFEWNRLISAKATSMGHIKKEDLQNAIIYIPTGKVFDNLSKCIEPIYDLLILNTKENLVLKSTQMRILSKLS